jgi:hypothetical protein
MRRPILACLLCLFAGVASADIVMLLAPDGSPLPAGSYRWLIVPSDATKPTVSTVIAVGGSVVHPPVVPPVQPPDVNTLDARLTLLLAAVDDAEKAETARKLKTAYEMTLTLTANSITDANSLRGVMTGIEKGVLDSLRKTSGWRPWTEGLAAIVAPMDFATVKSTFAAAAAKLGGGSVNPVPPTTPPDPTQPPLPTKPTAAVYIYEKDQAAVPSAVAVALQRINADGSGVVATDFDRDTVTGDGAVPQQYRSALAAANESGIPCLVVLAGDQVLRVIRDPRTESAVLEAVK